MWALQNLMEYYSQREIDVFENCTVPEPLNIDLLKSYIMRRCGLLQPVYGEPSLFKIQVKMWFDSNQWRMEHLCNMLLSEYSPAENIFEHDHWEEAHSGTDKDGGTQTFQHGETHTLSGKDTTTDTTNTTHEVSAYNSSSYQADSKDSNGGKIEVEYGKKDTASGTDTHGFGKTFTHGEKIEYTRDRNGNVGVKSSSDLMQEELNLLERFNVYDTLASWFEKELMIQVY